MKKVLTIKKPADAGFFAWSKCPFYDNEKLSEIQERMYVLHAECRCPDWRKAGQFFSRSGRQKLCYTGTSGGIAIIVRFDRFGDG
jgi:hypothetical protein